VFNEHTVFNGKTEDLIDNLMHSTLEEIATLIRTIKLLSPAHEPETESFYKDDTAEETAALDNKEDQLGYYQGRKIRDTYPTPPLTLPLAALLANLMTSSHEELQSWQGTLTTIL
jgi:hypothetical protein